MPAIRRPNPSRAAAAILALSLLPACSSSAKLPAGPGLVSTDRAAPAGVAPILRPTWSAGDTLEYVRGGSVRMRYRVEAAEDGWRLVNQDQGHALVFDADFRHLGEQDAKGEWIVRTDPVDPALDWPLWPGKRWSGGYVARGADREVPILVRYECGAPERITTPAGTVDAYPIWGTLSLAGAERSLDRTVVIWYAPEWGWFARRLEGGVLTELAAVHRQGGAHGASTNEPGKDGN